MGKFKDNIRDKVIHNLKKVIAAGDINFTGDMTKSIHKETQSNIQFVIIDSPYAGLVDKGMSPGTWVNFDKLHAWVEGKLKILDKDWQMKKIFFFMTLIFFQVLFAWYFCKDLLEKFKIY